MIATALAGFTLVGLAGLTGYYWTRAARRPELTYRRSPLIDHLLASCPTLVARFRPPLWGFNRHVQLAILALRDARTAPLRFDCTELLTLADGGTVSLDWLGLDDPTVSDETPTLVVLPTICGDGQSLRRTVQAMRRGLEWRVVVCNRRGHGPLPLTAPRFSTLGSTDDVRTQLEHIHRRVPRSPLYALGASAGTALLVRYLGEEGDRTPLAAAVAYCPGYDTTRAFHRIHRLYDRYLIRAVRRYFLERHAEVLRDLPGYAEIADSRTVGEFHDRQYRFAGFASVTDFHQRTNPMLVARNVRIPLLILNAADDPVCVVENVHEHRDLFDTVPDSMLVLTARGSHCAFFEGQWRPRSWAHRLIAEYFRAVHAAPGARRTPAR